MSIEKFNSKKRFSDRVSNYVKYRPSYPKKIIDFLQEEIEFEKNHIVADIGFGTGLLTKLFLDNNNKVYGVEPNKEMRKAGEEYLRDYKSFISLDRSAESTGMDSSSIDLIIAGQAFHWFDFEPTKNEFNKILKEKGRIMLVWNERDNDGSKFCMEYENLLNKYCPDYRNLNQHNGVFVDKIKDFFSPKSVIIKEFENYQMFNMEGLKGRLDSSSYSLKEGNEDYNDLIGELENIFEKYQEKGKVKFVYKTILYLSGS